MLRATLLVIGLAMVAGAAALARAGCTPGAVLRLALPGLILIGALAVERWRYKQVAGGLPGPGWIATNEQFVDPESGKLVTVYYRASTGERRYVEARPAR